MKSLQAYLIENLDQIEEGKIWDAIKNWFKELFEPSERPYDRYNPDNELTGAERENYIDYLKNNFDIDCCELKKVDTNSLSKIINPNGVKPDLENKYGFYKFIDSSKGTYMSIVYKDNQVKDTSTLIKYTSKGKTFEILDFQTIQEFMNVFTLKDLIKVIKEDESFKKSYNEIIFKESSDKDIYKQLINDCEFETEFDNELDTNIAKLSI
jgi:hypothetical protein